MEPSRWMTDLYLKTSKTRDDVFAFLEAEGLGAKQGQYGILGSFVEVSIRKNPDSTGNSPFGRAPWLLEVAMPAGVIYRDFKPAYQLIKECLRKNGVPFESSKSDDIPPDAL
jgi:hypothetical protein